MHEAKTANAKSALQPLKSLLELGRRLAGRNELALVDLGDPRLPCGGDQGIPLLHEREPARLGHQSPLERRHPLGVHSCRYRSSVPTTTDFGCASASSTLRAQTSRKPSAKSRPQGTLVGNR